VAFQEPNGELLKRDPREARRRLRLAVIVVIACAIYFILRKLA
jgi:hypothetical protein